MEQYNIIAEQENTTVMAHYEALPREETAYQSEAALEEAFVRQLAQQGYERVNITSEQELIENLRRQMDRLNGLTLSDSESRGCAFDGWFYLLDGTHFVRVREVPYAGTDALLSSQEVEGYVPTCILNGEPYEPANLLSNVYRIAADLSDPAGYSSGDVRYGKGSREGEAILVSAASASGDVYLPETVMTAIGAFLAEADGAQRQGNVVIDDQ